MPSNWRKRPRPSSNRWSRVGRITGNTGKSAEGETVALRPVVTKKWGNAHGAKGLAAQRVLANMGGRDEMTKTPIRLQDLRRRLYVEAKAEPAWRFWGLYLRVCKRETLWEAYQLAKENDGAPGIDGMTFQASQSSMVLPCKGSVWQDYPFLWAAPFRQASEGYTCEYRPGPCFHSFFCVPQPLSLGSNPRTRVPRARQSSQPESRSG